MHTQNSRLEKQLQDTKMDYQEFLKSKHKTIATSGFEVNADDLNPKLHPFQRDIVLWSLGLGKAAIFAAVGLGKTFMQLEWARMVANHTGKPVLILAPLAVSSQTIREGKKFGIDAVYVSDAESVKDGAFIYVTNYERLEKFNADVFAGVVLDESSIIKNFAGKTKKTINDAFAKTAYKLACSATPAPNDYTELANHSEFLNVMPRVEVLARWFIHDSYDTKVWRLKGHAKDDFWRWLTSWAVCITRPTDLGDHYHIPGYDLPPLELIDHRVPIQQETIERAHANGRLLPDTRPSSTDLAKVKRESIEARVNVAKEIIAAMPDDEPVLIWCQLNDEADALAAAIPDAAEVRGSDTPEAKAEKLLGFSDGTHRILITKPSIAGFGMNWQHCAEPIFLGLDFSFESFYQAIGRNYRYGQTRTVNAHIINAEAEGSVVTTLQRKQSQFETMQSEMAKAMSKHGLFREGTERGHVEANNGTVSGNGWTLHNGDCVPISQGMKDTIDLSIYSPPFSNLYVYSDHPADMGNSSSDDEFGLHYRYLVKELYRLTRPGRLTVVHCSDLPVTKTESGFIGIKDFSGDIIKAHQDAGWIYHSRITIWKDPVVEMTRTKTHGLLHKTFTKDATKCRVGMPDYLLIFRKPGDDQPVAQNRAERDYIGTEPPAAPLDKGDRRRYSIEVWQRYASPVWFDIQQTNVLNYQQAKSDKDEKHICPLQLDVIARCIDLWSNPGDTVMSPFAGIGSEGYEAIKMGRKFIGIELKPEYHAQACKYLSEAEVAANQRTLFDLSEITA